MAGHNGLKVAMETGGESLDRWIMEWRSDSPVWGVLGEASETPRTPSLDMQERLGALLGDLGRVLGRSGEGLGPVVLI